jgi:hypothetical protein
MGKPLMPLASVADIFSFEARTLWQPATGQQIDSAKGKAGQEIKFSLSALLTWPNPKRMSDLRPSRPMLRFAL